MIVNIIDDPWKHAVIDNLLTNEEFDSILNYVKSVYDIENNTKGYVEVHRQGSGTVIDKILSPKIIELKDSMFDKLNYGGKILPESYYTFIELVICPPMYKYKKIHTDNPYKLMTTVLYLYPDTADGTDLYSDNTKNSFHSTIEWKPNRALCFVSQRKEEFIKSYHNYGNMRNSIRITFNMILTDNYDGNY